MGGPLTLLKTLLPNLDIPLALEMKPQREVGLEFARMLYRALYQREACHEVAGGLVLREDFYRAEESG